MRDKNKSVRVLYSFPLRLGADRICTTAWHQADGLAAAGAEVTVFSAAISRPLPANVKVRPTLARGKVRIPNRLLGRMAYARLHDWIVSRRIEKMAGQIDIIHTWPIGALQTLKTARRLGIPTVLERCNAHTRFAYEAVQKECERIGVPLPPGHEHEYNADILAKEEAEYLLADGLLCPSDFVVKTFRDRGFAPEKLVRHIYGVDEKRFFPDPTPRDPKRGLTIISVGVCAVRKGLHFALEAWLKSPASQSGTFLIAGEFLPEYRQKLSAMLAHPSIKVLGHRTDVPELVRGSDILVLPSIEEGFGLVCTEAMASGCVPLVSDACTELCLHNVNALVHHVGDIKALTEHITMLHEDRALLERLRAEGLKTVPEMTWNAAGVKLLRTYREILGEREEENRKQKAESGKRMTDSPQFEVKVLRTLEEAGQLRETWSSMQWNPESDIDFASFIINVRPEIIRPHVIVVYKNGKPLALLAGRLEHGHLDIKIGYKAICRIKVRRIGIFYGGLMGEATPEITEIVVRRLIRSLREEKADLLVWTVPSNSDLQRLLNHIPNPLCRDYLARASPHWILNLPPTLEEFIEQRLGQKSRRWARKAMQLIEKNFAGEIRYACYSSPGDMDVLFNDAREVARKTYQWGLGVGFRDSEEQRKRFRLEAEKGWFRGYVLYLKNKPVAFSTGIIYKGTMYGEDTGYDPDLCKHDVGSVLFFWVFRQLCREKINKWDFGMGTSFYKERFCDFKFDETTLHIFASSFRGVCLNVLRLLTGGPLELIRNILRRLGLEQRAKKAWRACLTPAQAAKESSQTQE